MTEQQRSVLESYGGQEQFIQYTSIHPTRMTARSMRIGSDITLGVEMAPRLYSDNTIPC